MAPTTLSAIAQQASGGVCNTPACLALSKTLLANVNLNIDPCSDFFQFTCGGWLKTEPVKDKTTSYNLIAQTQQHSLQDIVSILNGTFEDLSEKIQTNDKSYHTQDERATDKKNFELVQNYYNNCVDTEARLKAGVTPIYKYIAHLENVLFPNAEEIDPKQLALALIATSFQDVPTILDIKTAVNPFNHTQRIAYLSSPGLDEDVDYSSVDSLAQYKSNLITVLNKVLGGPSSDDSEYGRFAFEESKKSNFTFWSASKVELAVSRYIDFELKLGYITKIDEPDFDVRVPTLHELKNSSHLIDWDTFLSAATANHDYITPDTPVAFTTEQVEILDAILAETPVKTVQEYLVIQTVKHRLPYLKLDTVNEEASSSSSSLLSRFKNLFQAPTPKEPASTDISAVCGHETSVNFRDIVGRFFALSTFGASAEKKQAEEFVEMLYTTWLHDMLPHTDWIGKETMKNVIEKIENLDKKVVYSTTSPDWRNPSALEEYYQGLKSEDSYVDSLHFYKEWKNTKLWEKLPYPLDEREWSQKGYPHEFNAQYDFQENTIEIPIGVFQAPFYNPGYPEYINYGALGPIVGHEFTHSLDDTGRLYDKDGYKNTVFTKEDGATYDKKAQCFIDQYNKFSLLGPEDSELPLNGTNVLGENIADNGGIRIAYNAYHNYIKKRGAPEKPLPGFEKYTPEQLFFIGRAQFTCATESKSDAQNDIDTDVHAPLYYRNIGAFQNSEEFAKAFNCPAGSPMNPTKKCSVW